LTFDGVKQKYNNKSGEGEDEGGNDARAMMPFSGCAPMGTHSKDLNGATTALRLQKTKLLAGLGRCDNAVAEHASAWGNADADAAAREGAAVAKKCADALLAPRTTRERMRVDLAWWGREVECEFFFMRMLGWALVAGTW
jgi:hypothetical protein